MLRFAASDLGLDCLPMSHLWDSRHKWVKAVSAYCFLIYLISPTHQEEPLLLSCSHVE